MVVSDCKDCEIKKAILEAIRLLVERDKDIKELRETNNELEQTLREYQDYIRRMDMEFQKIPHWRDVRVSVPEVHSTVGNNKSDEVLVQLVDKEIAIAYFEEAITSETRGYWFSAKTHEIVYVTHWMPLPEKTERKYVIEV